MEISIIVVNFNTKSETLRCVRSCMDDGSNVSFEIILIDNASGDESYEYFSSEFSKNKNVILIKNGENLGFSKAVNQGLNVSCGKYKYLLNSDTAIEKQTLKKLIERATKLNDAGVIGTALILPDKSIQKSCYNLPTFFRAIQEYWFNKKYTFSSFAPDDNGTLAVEAIVGASFFITPIGYEKVGLFDERYFMYFEDLDYCRRIKKSGLKIYYDPKIKIFHHHGLSGKNIFNKNDQWKRLVPSSIIYHGLIKHTAINFVIWSGQKFQKLLGK